MNNERKNAINIVAQAFYGNRTATEVSRENIDRFILGYLDNNIPIENLDLSYEKSKHFGTFEENKVDFVFWVSFFDNGENISIVRGKVSDMLGLSYKKAKSVTYGVTDGRFVLKVDISQQDVKGTEYEVLKNAIAYTFKKQTGQNCCNLDCMAVTYC